MEKKLNLSEDEDVFTISLPGLAMVVLWNEMNEYWIYP